MAGGRWTKWRGGHGVVDGHSLSLGRVRDLLGQVRGRGDGTWEAQVGSVTKTFDSREAAKAHVEFELRAEMDSILWDWAILNGQNPAETLRISKKS